MVVDVSRCLQSFHGSVEIYANEIVDAHVRYVPQPGHGSELLNAVCLAMQCGWSGPCVLDCAGVDVNDSACAQLAKSINELRHEAACSMPCTPVPHLQTFRLRNNQIGANGVWSLGISSTIFQNLISLDLSFNNIGPSGASHLGSCLPRCYGLCSLDLTCCGLGPSGFKEIGRALTLLSSLVELFLACNNIGDVGIASLVQW